MRVPSDPARRLILLYGAIVALNHVFYALPGGPYYPENSQFFWLVVDALLVWRMYRGSSFAWAISLLLSLLGIVLFVLLLGDLATFFLLIEVVALLAILLSRPVRDHVARRGATMLRAKTR